MTILRVIAVLLLILALPVAGVIAQETYRDGVYEGEFSFVKVRVTVREGRISDIEMLHHGGGGEKYENMVRPMLDEMIETQSVEVDGVTGATVSSVNLKQAVKAALEKAR